MTKETPELEWFDDLPPEAVKIVGRLAKVHDQAEQVKANAPKWLKWPTPSTTEHDLRKSLSKCGEGYDVGFEIQKVRIEGKYRLFVRWNPEAAIVDADDTGRQPASTNGHRTAARDAGLAADPHEGEATTKCPHCSTSLPIPNGSSARRELDKHYRQKQAWRSAARRALVPS